METSKFTTGRKSKPIVILSLISLVVLGIFVAYSYKPKSSQQFALDGYYKPEKRDEVSAIELYEELCPPLGYGDAACMETMTRGTNTSLCGRYTWIVDDQTAPSDFSSCKKDNYTLTPYSDGDSIIAPADTNEFVNSNLGPFYGEEISVIIKTGKYIVRFDNVDSWWCHINRANPLRHSTRIGANGLGSQCYRGYVIAQANASTEVTFYALEGEEEKQITPEEYFFGS